ncbi:hypothetical protein BDV10DRAFT_177066 [Aspergillus recurvatus]
MRPLQQTRGSALHLPSRHGRRHRPASRGDCCTYLSCLLSVRFTWCDHSCWPQAFRHGADFHISTSRDSITTRA